MYDKVNHFLSPITIFRNCSHLRSITGRLLDNVSHSWNLLGNLFSIPLSEVQSKWTAQICPYHSRSPSCFSTCSSSSCFAQGRLSHIAILIWHGTKPQYCFLRVSTAIQCFEWGNYNTNGAYTLEHTQGMSNYIINNNIIIMHHACFATIVICL